MKCTICGLPMDDSVDVVMVPPVIANTGDYLHQLSDSTCHCSCLDRDPRKSDLIKVINQYKQFKSNKLCIVCGSLVRTHHEHFGTFYLGTPDSRIGRFNYVVLHKKHIAQWPNLVEFLEVADDEISSGRWRGPVLKMLVDEVRQQMNCIEEE
jgi:hypothetical protein